MSSKPFNVVQDEVNELYPTLEEQQAYAESIGCDLGKRNTLEDVSEEIAFFAIRNNIAVKADAPQEAPVGEPQDVADGELTEEVIAAMQADAPDSPPVEGNGEAPAPPSEAAQEDDFVSPIPVEMTAVHWVRQIVPGGPGAGSLINDPNLLTGAEAEEYIRRMYLENGYELAAFHYLGRSIESGSGHGVMGIFIKPQDREAQQSDIRIMLRPLTTALTEFQPNQWLSHHIEQGFRLFASHPVEYSPAAVFTLWVLVK